MIHSRIAGSILDGTSPPADGGAVSGPVCTDCGGCSFSDLSSVEVKIHTVKRRADCSLYDTHVTETWAYSSHDGTKFRWQKDASNWVEYSCVLNRWSYATTVSDHDFTAGGGACLGVVTGSPFQLDSCTNGRFWVNFNGVFWLIFEIDIQNNDCATAIAV